MTDDAEEQAPARGSSRLAELARQYADGKVAWRDIAAETGIAFGDLLVELGRQNLQLPRATPEMSPEQAAMFAEVLRRAAQRGKAK